METRTIFHQQVKSFIRTDTVLFSESLSVDAVIKKIRSKNISDQIVYFYVVDEMQKLVGVLPLRRLISACPEQSVGEVMLRNVITVNKNDTLAETFKVFNKHKYLSLPVIDGEKKFIGVLDISVLTGSTINPSEKRRFDDVFETIGIRSSCISYLTPLSAFKHRFPWLVPTIISGISCAVLSSFFEQTIADSLVIAFFLTLILGLGESVSIQTLTITIRQLHVEPPSWMWFLGAIRRELFTALYLGLGVGLVIAMLVYLWKRSIVTGLTIGASIILSLSSACFFGLTIPSLLHRTKLDPKVSAGPLVLGLADLFTLFFYFTLARLFL